MNYSCDICGKEFDNGSSLQGHKNFAHGKKEKKVDRKKRIPLSVPRLKLTTEDTPGKKRRWILDKGDRLMQAQQAGYEFVKDPNVKVGEDGDGNTDLGAMVSKVGNPKEGGERLYLMEIEQEFYDEDQRAKQEELDEIEAAIKLGKYKNDLGGSGYVPKDGIRVEHST